LGLNNVRYTNRMFGQGDLTARARIRHQALRLFADHGPDAVTVRQIATAAGVSPALLLHHYGSKQGLRRAVDEHVTGVFDALFAEFSSADGVAALTCRAARPDGVDRPVDIGPLERRRLQTAVQD
jgi:AcrR family transcriptional regulator